MNFRREKSLGYWRKEPWPKDRLTPQSCALKIELHAGTKPIRSWRSAVRQLIRWSLTVAFRDADIWHLSDSLTLCDALAEARREQFPFLVQRRLVFSEDGALLHDSGNAMVRVSGVPLRRVISHPWHVECLRCNAAAQFIARRDAEWWRDIHEFENYRDGHMVRILLQTDKSMVDMAEVITLDLDRNQ